MGRIERAYNDALSQAGGMNDVVETIKQRMSSEISKYEFVYAYFEDILDFSIFICRFLSIKATVSEPKTIEMMFNCISASSLWLTQVSMARDGLTEFKEVTFPLSDDVPNTLR